MAIRREDLERLQASFDWAAWRQRLTDSLRSPLLTIAIDQSDETQDEYDLDVDPEEAVFTVWADQYLGARITQVDETTRARIRAELEDAFQDGDVIEETVARILDAVDGSAAFSSARALTIAQTEAATAYNVGSALAFRANGITSVDIHDGEECDEECADANGDVWTIDEFLDNPLQHPNCGRWGTPHVDEEG